MFLVRLFKHDRIAAIIVSALLLGFIYLNYKWGFVATPLLQYGMYSQPVPIEGERTIYRILDADGIDQMPQLNFSERDQLTHYLNGMSNLSNNDHIRSVFMPVLSMLHIANPPSKFGVQDSLLERSGKWLGERVSKWINENSRDKVIRFERSACIWNGSKLIPSQPNKLIYAYFPKR